MTRAKLNSEFIATKAGDMTVFNYDGETREYLSSSVEFLATGVGIPANSCIDEPGESKEGFVICRTTDFTGWEYIPDHRGETVYSTDNGMVVVIDYPGPVREGFTSAMPATPYDHWDGSAGVTDIAAEQAANIADAETRRSQLRAIADAEISWRQDAVDSGIATDTETAALSEWKKYRVLLMRVDTAKPVWPVNPQDI